MKENTKLMFLESSERSQKVVAQTYSNVHMYLFDLICFM